MNGSGLNSISLEIHFFEIISNFTFCFQFVNCLFVNFKEDIRSIVVQFSLIRSCRRPSKAIGKFVKRAPLTSALSRRHFNQCHWAVLIALPFFSFCLFFLIFGTKKIIWIYTYQPWWCKSIFTIFERQIDIDLFNDIYFWF